MKRVLSLTAAGAAAVLVAGAASGVVATAHPTPSAQPRAVAVTHLSAAQAARARTTLRSGRASGAYGVSDICKANKLHCQAQVLTANRNSSSPLSSDTPLGYGPADLGAAYGVANAPKGSGTIAVIGAGADPKLASDLAAYRATYGLPACTVANGCFKQVNYLGGKPYKPTTGGFNKFIEEQVAVETSLDVDMASAGCPGCNIISIQVPLADAIPFNKKQSDAATLDFATGVTTAHSLGATATSISYGYEGDKYNTTGRVALLMTQPGMALVASSGDYGFNFFFDGWPEGLRTVTSAGGTSLYPDPKAVGRKFQEVAWEGAGSNCEKDIAPAVGQPISVSEKCNGHRASSDVSADADPYTGAAVYDTYAPYSHEPLDFIVVGGTSLSSPYLAGLYARSGNVSGVTGPNTIYQAPASSFHDITLGTNAGIGYCGTLGISNAVCDAKPGWDGPTGRGTPKGLATFGG